MAASYALGVAIMAALVLTSAQSVTTKAANTLRCVFADHTVPSSPMVEMNEVERECHGGTQGGVPDGYDDS